MKSKGTNTCTVNETSKKSLQVSVIGKRTKTSPEQHMWEAASLIHESVVTSVWACESLKETASQNVDEKS